MNHVLFLLMQNARAPLSLSLSYWDMQVLLYFVFNERSLSLSLSLSRGNEERQGRSLISYKERGFQMTY